MSRVPRFCVIYKSKEIRNSSLQVENKIHNKQTVFIDNFQGLKFQ